MKKKLFFIIFLCKIALGAMFVSDKIYKSTDMSESILEDNSIPEYSGKPAIPIKGNKTYWKADEYTTEAFENL